MTEKKDLYDKLGSSVHAAGRVLKEAAGNVYGALGGAGKLKDYEAWPTISNGIKKKRQQGGSGGTNNTAGDGARLGGDQNKTSDVTQSTPPSPKTGITGDLGTNYTEALTNLDTIQRQKPEPYPIRRSIDELAGEDMGLSTYLGTRRQASPGGYEPNAAYDSRGNRLSVPEVKSNNGLYMGAFNPENRNDIERLNSDMLSNFRDKQAEKIRSVRAAERRSTAKNEINSIIEKASRNIESARFRNEPSSPVDRYMLKYATQLSKNLGAYDVADLNVSEAIAMEAAKDERQKLGLDMRERELGRVAEKDAQNALIRRQQLALDATKADTSRQLGEIRNQIAADRVGIAQERLAKEKRDLSFRETQAKIRNQLKAREMVSKPEFGLMNKTMEQKIAALRSVGIDEETIANELGR